MTDSLLSVKDLCVEFSTDDGPVRAVDGVCLDVAAGETLGVVGESGCGKSVTALSVMRLIQAPAGRIVKGSIRYRDQDLLGLSPEAMRKLRGNRISMIFQEPMTSLNPVFTVGDQIGEAIRLHQGATKKEAEAHAIDMLGQVGIPAPDQRVRSYPHELSGGMRQRVMIAMALSCKPDLLIADEPTTALDVTIQAQILDLIRDLQSRLGMAVILITHDLGVVAETCDRVQVMYAGRVVEVARATSLFSAPRHPYSLGLLRSVPGWQRVDATLPTGKDGRPRLRTIEGMVPNLQDLDDGCRFRDRCQFAQEDCAGLDPGLRADDEGRQLACLHPVVAPEAA